jgi:hypothetical protein
LKVIRKAIDKNPNPRGRPGTGWLERRLAYCFPFLRQSPIQVIESTTPETKLIGCASSEFPVNFARKVSAIPTQLTPYYAERLIMQKGADMSVCGARIKSH